MKRHHSTLMWLPGLLLLLVGCSSTNWDAAARGWADAMCDAAAGCQRECRHANSPAAPDRPQCYAGEQARERR